MRLPMRVNETINATTNPFSHTCNLCEQYQVEESVFSALGSEVVRVRMSRTVIKIFQQMRPR